MFDLLTRERLSDLHFKQDSRIGLQAIIAIHSTQLGPALGGCRFIEYESPEQALTDASRLAKGMSYKAALAGVPQGGGKAVILKPHGEFDRQAIFNAFGDFVEELGGRYITAIDSGTTAADMDIISRHTLHTTSTTTEDNPSVYTAKGVFYGIQTAVKQRLKKNNLAGIKVAIQGLGNVGYPLGLMLHQAGADLIVADLDENKVQKFMQETGASWVSCADILNVSCDVLAPCGLGAIINDQTIPGLNCKIIAGSANNQLLEERHGIELAHRNILYAPDYVINAGGLIYASLHHNHCDQQITAKVDRLAHTLGAIFEEAERQQLATNLIANQMAEHTLHAH